MKINPNATCVVDAGGAPSVLYGVAIVEGLSEGERIHTVISNQRVQAVGPLPARMLTARNEFSKAVYEALKAYRGVGEDDCSVSVGILTTRETWLHDAIMACYARSPVPTQSE